MGPLVTDGGYDLPICKMQRTIEIRAYKKKKTSFLLSLRFCEIIFILPTFALFFFNIHNYFSITFEFGMVEQVTQENGIKLI